MPTIVTIYDERRGCGWRKPGGTYLIGSSGPALACCKLPFPLTECPCCGNEIKFTRGWQWITTRLFSTQTCKNEIEVDRLQCIMNRRQERLGLMWVGELYYTAYSFSVEADRLGISKRIGTVPKDCKPGTWVALAHVKAVPVPGQLDYTGPTAVPLLVPGIFRVFKITSIDYVVTGQEPVEQLEQLERDGYRLVKVERLGEQIGLDL